MKNGCLFVLLLLVTACVPSEKESGPDALVVIFPSFSADAARTSAEFPLDSLDTDGRLEVVYLDYNRKLWLTEAELAETVALVEDLRREAAAAGALPLYLGGFSSGGNLALLTGAALEVAGVFVVDAPVDLERLFRLSEENARVNNSQEGHFLLRAMETGLGHPDSTGNLFAKYSPVLLDDNHFANIEPLGKARLRLYTEPDSAWWAENRNLGPELLNAATLRGFHRGWREIYPTADASLVLTENRGYRPDGRRHPHSWSIVDAQDLIDWILHDQ